MNASSESATATTAASSTRRASRSASPPAAAIRCVPLMSASPSFACSATGESPARASAAAPGIRSPACERLALADQHEPEVGERREVAGRPDRAAARDHRHDVALEQREQQLDELHAHARVPAPQRGREQQQHAAHDLGVERLTRADGVGAEQVDLQLDRVRGIDPHGGELAEPGA